MMWFPLLPDGSVVINLGENMLTSGLREPGEEYSKFVYYLHGMDHMMVSHVRTLYYDHRFRMRDVQPLIVSHMVEHAASLIRMNKIGFKLPVPIEDNSEAVGHFFTRFCYNNRDKCIKLMNTQMGFPDNNCVIARYPDYIFWKQLKKRCSNTVLNMTDSDIYSNDMQKVMSQTLSSYFSCNLVIKNVAINIECIENKLHIKISRYAPKLVSYVNGECPRMLQTTASKSTLYKVQYSDWQVSACSYKNLTKSDVFTIFLYDEEIFKQKVEVGAKKQIQEDIAISTFTGGKFDPQRFKMRDDPHMTKN